MKNHIVFGGITDFNKETLKVRINQIIDKFRLHTCYFYGDALKVINKASKETNIKPDLVVKLYYNYNFFYLIMKNQPVRIKQIILSKFFSIYKKSFLT